MNTRKLKATATLTMEEWTTILGTLAKWPLSDEGKQLYSKARLKLGKQVLAAQEKVLKQ